MKAKRGLLTGSKMTTNHTTVTAESAKVIEAAKACPLVTKIVLGPIAPLGYAKPRLKFIPVTAGWRVGVRGTTSHMTLFVYTNNPPETKKFLEDQWEDTYGT